MRKLIINKISDTLITVTDWNFKTWEFKLYDENRYEIRGEDFYVKSIDDFIEKFYGKSYIDCELNAKKFMVNYEIKYLKGGTTIVKSSYTLNTEYVYKVNY